MRQAWKLAEALRRTPEPSAGPRGIDMLRCFTQARCRVNHIVRLLVVSTLLGFCLPAQAAPPASAEEVAISAPRPEYPYDARRHKITGSGVVVFIVDPKSGSVTNAVMAQSTGSPILDNAALRAFRRWRFKPGTATRLKSPITFSMGDTRRSVGYNTSRQYPYRGTVKAVNVQAATIIVQGSRGPYIIVITPGTRLSKNRNAVVLGKVVVGDSVRGRARITPDGRGVATSAIIESSPR